MAIYHLSAKTISRSAGRSSTAAAAYRAGVEIADERTGEVHDYTRKGGVEYAELFMPSGNEKDRAEFWNEIEKHHKRGDAVVAREIEVSLPAELSKDDRKELAVAYAKELATRYGVATDVAIHEPSKKGDERNHHAHILLSACYVNEKDELGKKCVELDPIHCQRHKLQNAVEFERERWADLVNDRLKENGIQERVDHRSLKDQGIDREPTQHLGPTATAIERRTGEPSRKRQDWEQSAGERLMRAKALGEAEREIKALENSIIDLSGDITKAKAEREQDAKREAIRESLLASIERTKEVAPEAPTRPVEAKKEQLSDQEQVQRFEALQKRLAAQRQEKAGRVLAKAQARHERREKELYQVNRRRVQHESNPPGIFASLLRGKEYDARLADLRQAESVQLKLRSQAHESLVSLRKYQEPGLYGWPSPCERWAEAKARQLQPEVAAKMDRQKELEQEAKKQQLREQLQKKRERERSRGRGGIGD